MTSDKFKPIRTEAVYESALLRIDELMDAIPDSTEHEELEMLVEIVELYEAEYVPMGYPSPLAAIEFRMEQGNFSHRDLIPIIGCRTKVSELLSGKCEITKPMAHTIHEHLGIRLEVLLR